MGITIPPPSTQTSNTTYFIIYTFFFKKKENLHTLNTRGEGGKRNGQKQQKQQGSILEGRVISKEKVDHFQPKWVWRSAVELHEAVVDDGSVPEQLQSAGAEG